MPRKKEAGNIEIETEKKRWVKRIFDILCPDFHHENVPLSETTIAKLRLFELNNLYGFLTSEIIKPRDSFQRPECPIKSPKHLSLARYEYKKAMLDYISNFGYELTEPPCNYLSAFLEAFANYCEQKAQGENISKK